MGKRILSFLLVLAPTVCLTVGALAWVSVRDRSLPAPEESAENPTDKVHKENNEQAAGEQEDAAVEAVRERPEPPLDPSFVTQVERIRSDGDIPRIAAPIESLIVREKASTKSAELGRVTSGELLAQIGEGTGIGAGARVPVRVAGSDLTGYISADYAPVIEYPAVDPGALSVVDVSDALYTYGEMQDDIDELTQIYGDVLAAEEAGVSADGRSIPLLILGDPDAPSKIFVQAAIHGREYMTAQLIMKLVEYYACYYPVGSYQGVSYKELFGEHAFYIIPMANPDGVSISQLGEDAARSEQTRTILRECYERDKNLMVYFENDDGQVGWYDNYRGAYKKYNLLTDDPIDYETYLEQWKSNARGVDLNNNFDAGWASVVGKEEPSLAHYRGPSPESEPETKLLCRLAMQTDYAAYISYHARGNLIYYDADGKIKEAAKESLEIAQILQGVNGYGLVTEHSSTMNLGGFTDWLQLTKERTGVTVEIGKYQCPLDISEFYTIWLRNRESWAALAMNL